MPVSFAVGSLQKSGSQAYPVAQSITVGFQPKAMMLFCIANGTTSNTAFADNERPGFGWTTGSTANYNLSWGYDDQTVTGELTNTFRRARNDYCFVYGSSGSTAYPLCRCTGFTGTGANFEYDLNDTNTYRLFWVAVGGTDITGTKAGEFNCNTTTGNQSITGVGFQPSIVFFLTGNAPNVTSGSTPHMCVSMGVAKSSSARGALALTSIDEINPSDAARYQRTDKCVAFFTEGSTTLDAEADLVSLDADGFTINWTSAPTVARPIYYLAIAGGTWTVGSTNSRTSADGTGTTAITTSPAVTPKGVILFSYQGPTSGAVTTHSELSFGAAASTTSSVHFNGGNQDNSTVPSSYRSYNNGTSTSTVYVYKNHSVGTLNANNVHTGNEATFLDSRALLQSFDTNSGFTLNWDTVPSSVEQLIYVTVGDNVGAALVKVLPTETVGLTEARNKVTGFNKVINDTVGHVETLVRKTSLAIKKVLNDATIGLTEANPIPRLKKLAVINEGIFFGEVMLKTMTKRRVLSNTVGFVEDLRKVHIKPTSTLQGTFIQVRYSGGTTINAGTNSSSRGGTMSNNSVTDNTLGQVWDDVLAAESSAGRTEYRCYYIYNSHSSLTAYNCELWLDLTTPAGDSIEIGVGTAATGGTEQGPLASETTAPSGVSFTTAPDADSSISLGDIPPVTGRSIWIKRTVPSGTISWSDNLYRLRMSFFSNFSE